MKKLNQKGFTNHLMIFGIAILVIGAISFAGYRVYKGKQIEAKASSWGLVYQSDDKTITVKSCKRSTSSTYEVYLTNRSSYNVGIDVGIIRSSSKTIVKPHSNSPVIRGVTTDGGNIFFTKGGKNWIQTYYLPGPYIQTVPSC